MLSSMTGTIRGSVEVSASIIILLFSPLQCNDVAPLLFCPRAVCETVWSFFCGIECVEGFSRFSLIYFFYISIYPKNLMGVCMISLGIFEVGALVIRLFFERIF